jgi:hypothetical protein
MHTHHALSKRWPSRRSTTAKSAPDKRDFERDRHGRKAIAGVTHAVSLHH